MLKWVMKRLLKATERSEKAWEAERSEKAWEAGWEEAWSSVRKDGLTQRAWAHCVLGEREPRQTGRLEAV